MNQKKVIRARDVMQNNFLLMDGLATVQEAIDALLRENADTIFIKRRNEDDAFGIVVLTDIAQKVLAVDKAPERVNLYEIMAKPVMSIEPELSIKYCARLFSRFGLSVAPVIKDEKILGAVTYREIVLHGLFENSKPAGSEE